MELKGKFVKLLEIRNGVSNDKPWAVASFLVRAADNRLFCLEWFDDNCTELEKAKVGGDVKLDFKIMCREYKGRYYTSLRVSSIEFEKEDANGNNSNINDGLPF